MGRVSVRTASTSANSKAGVEQQIELPSGKYGRIPEPSSALLRRAESPANPVLPKQTVTKPFPATMRERMPLTSSLTGEAARADKCDMQVQHGTRNFKHGKGVEALYSIEAGPSAA